MDLADYGGTQPSKTVGLNVPPGHVLCSSRWMKSELVMALKGRGASVAFDDSLGSIDFRPSNSIAVIYVSEAELVAGNIHRRKIVKLRKANTVQGIVISERTQLNAQYFPALQKFVVLELGLTLVPVSRQNEAAGFLCALMEVELHPFKNEVRVRRKQASSENALLATLQTIPGLGGTKARALLERFPSLLDICRAQKEDLAAVVGVSCANNIIAFFSQPPQR